MVNQGNHAWLYQLKADEERAWSKRTRAEQRTSWPIIRWGDETVPGDLVVLWESGQGGGLRGWGVVSEMPEEEDVQRGRRWNVPVREECWLARPVSRSSVMEADAFDPANSFLRRAQGTNFRLEPHEADRLLRLIPPSSSAATYEVGRLLPHPRKDSPSLPPPVDVAGALRRVKGITGCSGWAERILASAKLSQTRIGGRVSTTRLLLGALAAAAEMAAGRPGKEREAAGLLALNRLALQHAGKFERLRAEYLAERSPGQADLELSFTENAEALLRASTVGPLSSSNTGVIQADALIAALLSVRQGGVVERLRPLGLDLEQVRRDLVLEIARSRPDLLHLWQAALKVTLEPGEVIAEPQPDGPGGAGAASFFSVARLGNDNAWQAGLNDKLGAAEEARAFAGLALARNFVPPLAVGVFGDWGSGKSFFMRLVHERIDELSGEARAQAAPGKKSRFLPRVVQIRFNAWHYMDTHLWASLVDHIFGELDKYLGQEQRSKSEQLFEQLATARELTLDSAEQLMKRRQEQEAAVAKVTRCERELAAAQEKLRGSPGPYWAAVQQHFAELVKGDEKALHDAAATLGLERAVGDARAMSTAIQALDDQRAKATVLAEGMRRELGARLWWIVAGCIAVPAALLALRSVVAFALGKPELVALFNDTLLGASGIFAAVAAVFVKARRHVNGAVATVGRFRSHMDEAVCKGTKQLEVTHGDAQADLVKLRAGVEESRALLAASTQRLAEAASEYNAGTGRARLLKFVRDRAAGETYSRHLGLVATVRKDFEELTAAMDAAASDGDGRGPEHQRDQKAYRTRVAALIRQARKAGNAMLRREEQRKLLDSARPKPLASEDTIDRIILYIDDLDRCQPDKVAEVLQAVHLLLSFKLFVVFVAVDVRWVSRALRTHYPMLLDDKARPGDADAATAHDYLEKIFQVPYWVRPMTPENSHNFLHDRLEHLGPEEDDVGAAGEPLAPPVSQRRESEDEDDNGDAPAEGANGDAGTPQEAHPATPPSPQPSPPGSRTPAAPSALAKAESSLLARHLELTKDEKEYMKSLAQCAGASPRRALRFLNVYQVVKASLPGGDAAALERGGFRALMTQVAIVTGAPDLLSAWVALVERQDRGTRVAALPPVVDAEESLAQPDQRRKLRQALEILAKADPEATVEALKRHADLARRYSFTG